MCKFDCYQMKKSMVKEDFLIQTRSTCRYLMTASTFYFSRLLINVSSTIATDGDRILVVNCESLIPFKVYTTSYNLNAFNPVYCSSQIFFALFFLQVMFSKNINST